MVAPSPGTPAPAGPGSGPISGTMELPAPRKQSSTTMRNATGERQAPITFNRPRRSRAPMMVAGVALVSAVAVLVILRGGAGTGRREDSEPSTLDQFATSRSGSPAPEPVRRESSPPARPPEAEAPVTVPAAGAKIPRPELTPARRDSPPRTNEASAARADERADNDGRPRKPAGKPGRKPGRIAHGKRPSPTEGETAPEEPERAVPLPNQAPIIPL
jgi:hypothetical protein